MKPAGNWPNFFIVGAPRAGTTSLYYYLQQHPQVFMSPFKEPHFFAQIKPSPDQSHLFYPMDQARYLRLFRGAMPHHAAIGEASPSYLVTEGAAARIKAVIPQARIIIMLRDPVERAFSHYLMDVRDGVQTLPFLEALVRDHEAPAKGWGISRLYVEEGLYCNSIKRYLHFFGRQHVAVSYCEALALNAEAVVRHVLEFLSLDSALLPAPADYRVHNAFSVSRNGISQRVIKSKWLRRFAAPLVPPSWRAKLVPSLLHKEARKPLLDPEAVRYLKQIFAPDLARLEDLLGCELPFPTAKGQLLETEVP